MLAGKKRSRTAGGADADSAKRKKKTKGGAASLGGGRPKSNNNNGTMFPANPASLLDSESIDCLASPHGRTCQPVRTPVLSADDRDILIDRLRKEVVDKFGFTLSRKAERSRAAGGRDGGGGSGSGGGVTFTMGGGGIKMVVEGDDTLNTEEENEDKKGRKKKRPRPSPAEREPTLADLVVKMRLVVGVNQCTRALEAAANNANKKNCKPSLVLLSRDVRPPTILAHVPVLCQQMGIPAVVLPGRASVELGKAVGGRSVAVALFLPRSTDNTGDTNDPDDNKEEKKTMLSNDGPSDGQILECHRRIDSYVKFALSKVPSGGGNK